LSLSFSINDAIFSIHLIATKSFDFMFSYKLMT